MLWLSTLRSVLVSATILSTLSLATATPHPTPPSSCIPHAVSAHERREIFDGYVHAFFIEKNLTKAFQHYVSSQYIQHNPFVANGPAATLAFLGPIWKSQNLTILHTALDGDFGWIHYRDVGLPGVTRPTAIVDIVRFEESCVVEHWDVIEELPANATNPLALF
jgi:predicted SnoaL-like aldol condensation-catalyzing enzyme